MKIKKQRGEFEVGYDPFKHPAMPLEVVKQHFGATSDARKASALMRDNPALYRSMKQVAIDNDLISEPKSLSKQHSERHTPKAPTDAQQAAMAVYDKASCEKYYRGVNQEPGTKDNLSKLPAEQRAVLRLAAIGHGTIPGGDAIVVNDNSHSAQFKQRQRSIAEELAANASNGEHRFRLSDEIAIKANVPLGTMVSMAEFGKVCMQAGRNERAAKETSPNSDPPADSDTKAAKAESESD